MSNSFDHLMMPVTLNTISTVMPRVFTGLLPPFCCPLPTPPTMGSTRPHELGPVAVFRSMYDVWEPFSHTIPLCSAWLAGVSLGSNAIQV